MRYVFKGREELFYGMLTAAVVVILMELVGLDPESVSDWRRWAIALGGAATRAAAGAALDWIRRSMVSPDGEGRS